MTYSKEQIFSKLQEIIKELFGFEPEQVTLESKLYDDLDLDSIDAVDLVVNLKSITDKRFTPEEFNSVKTVGDVVDVIYLKLNADN